MNFLHCTLYSFFPKTQGERLVFGLYTDHLTTLVDVTFFECADMISNAAEHSIHLIRLDTVK